MPVAYTTRPCVVCHKTTTILLDSIALLKWERGALVQDAFPNLSANDRELLMSGTHPECWDKLFDPDFKP